MTWGIAPKLTCKEGAAVQASLDLYRVFYQVAISRSFTLAAQALFISQPAVSRSIRQLEEELHCSLFVRTPRGVVLTREGETLLRHVAAGLDQIAQGEKKLAAQVNLDSGEICVGASDMTLRFFLLPYLERFHSLYPGVKIHVTNGPTPETLRFLEQGRIDFGVVSEPAGDLAALSPIPVGQVQDIFIAGERFAHLADKPLPLAAFETLPVICLEKNTSTRGYLDRFFADNGAVFNPEFELATSSLIVQFACRNLGIGCVVEDFAREALADGRIVRLMTEKDIPPRRLCLVRGTAPSSKAAERLLELILS